MQVISVYISGAAQLMLKSFLAGIYLWFCAILSVAFYGVDRKEDDESWGWIQVILFRLKMYQLLPLLKGSGWRIVYLWLPKLTQQVMKNHKKPFKSINRSFSGLYLPVVDSVFRFQFVVVFLIANLLITIVIFLSVELPQIFLVIFVANAFLYLAFYLFMKLRAKEMPTAPCWTFLALTILCAISAIVFYTSKVKITDASAADSKMINEECLPGLNFFDNHDLWHFLSSFGLFFGLMFLLTLDDDISDWNQSDIQVW